jgi:hypothetical protein
MNRARERPPTSSRRRRGDTAPVEGPIFITSVLARPSAPPSPPSTPPPLGDADPDILTGRRAANLLPSGEAPTPIFTQPSPRIAARLGLPAPMQGPGAPPPAAYVKAPDGRWLPYAPGEYTYEVGHRSLGSQKAAVY